MAMDHIVRIAAFQRRSSHTSFGLFLAHNGIALQPKQLK